MKPSTLFEMIKYGQYTKSGDAVDWAITTAEGRTWLLFQDSKDKRDWINNFKFRRKLYKDQENTLIVHGGYGKAYKSANDVIMAEAVKYDNLAIAGWSFGGAMALLAAEDYHYRTGRKPEVVTFGAPKVAGTKSTANYLRSCGEYFQYADANDPVPLMPPFPGFHHVNKIKVGGPFCILEWKDADYYHTHYDEEDYNDKDL